LRLIAQRLPAEAAEKNRRRIRTGQTRGRQAARVRSRASHHLHWIGS
jgi:hypothetical protein